MIRSPIHLSIFILIALFLAACGSRPTPPSAIVLTDAPTRIALPTITASPSPGLFTAIHSQITYAPTRTPTPTLVPTFPPATPAAGPEGYRLREWTEPEALNLVTAIQDQALEYSDVSTCCEFIAFSSQHRWALTVREALLRFPASAKRIELEWDLARALAHSRYDLANTWITHLLEYALNEEHLSIEQLPQLISQHALGDPDLVQSDNLFGAGRPGYILSIVFATGATYAISESGTGPYEVKVIDSMWDEPLLDAYSVSVGDHTADGIPEVAIEYGGQHGMGPTMSEMGVSIYQWQNEQWANLTAGLSNTHLTGWGSWGYSPTLPGKADNLVVISANDGSMYPALPWDKTYTFYWDRVHYQAHNIQIAVPDRALDVFELLAMPPIWDWAESEQTYSVLTPMSEKTLANWPAPDTDVWGNGSSTFVSLAGPAYRDYFQFQLGRLYAFAGYPDQADEVLQEVANKPNAPEYALVSEMAKAFRPFVNNPSAADESVTHLLEALSPCSQECSGLADRIMQFKHYRALQFAVPTPTPASTISVSLLGEVYWSAADSFLRTGDIAHFVSTIQSTLSDPMLNCQIDNCEGLLYLLGLAHELSGHEREAVQAYWQLWHDYPDSPYTLMARRKLEVIEP